MAVAAHLDDDIGRIVLTPNRSWTWRANLWLVASLAAISVITGVVWTALGFWPVLAATGTELLIVLGCLYYCVRRTHRTEVVTFSRDDLVIERGIGAPDERHTLPRFFARIHVHAPTHAWREPRIVVRSREDEFELGAFLSGADKRLLERELRRMVHHFA